MTAYDPGLRRLGYRVRTGPPSPLLAILGRAECRMRPLYRLRPFDGHWIGACPFCGREDACYVEPGLTEWSVTCGCSSGGTVIELSAALILAAVAA